MSGRLGRDFGRLWAAAGVSNVGDGVYATALPLLAATITRDPLAVSSVTFAEWLPWLVFGLVSGALVDRWERRRVMWTVDAARFVVVGALTAAVLAGWASIPLLLATGFLLGTGQTLVDTAAVSFIPVLVSRDPDRLNRANGRLQGTQLVAQQFAGPPLGGWLFSLVRWAPFALDALSFAASSALVASMRLRPAGRMPGNAEATRLIPSGHRAGGLADVDGGISPRIVREGADLCGDPSRRRAGSPSTREPAAALRAAVVVGVGTPRRTRRSSTPPWRCSPATATTA